ncbi:hypothetical protein C7M61_004986 [Candidozyma pseudohaemuli]|uniref:Uncharacterized protein n=1 Tax=Candidozyma pseudohaemuli TaxID=418784 RepID=A0A2P7YF86_9ASCO|nr:hypothetical protein C7M61_004986 [[Candida] pseudohaemulonii]PSK34626.1 hypothetical protein C7M61_004986 [[Candida] pseudohaemulonii]
MQGDGEKEPSIYNLLKHGTSKLLPGITVWPMLNNSESSIYFNHQDRELGLAIYPLGSFWKPFCNGSFYDMSFTGALVSDERYIFPLKGSWAYSWKELEVSETTLNWILGNLKEREHIEETLEPDDWGFDNCAVSNETVYFVSTIGKSTGSWIVKLPILEFYEDEMEYQDIFHIDLKNPQDLLVNANLLLGFEDMTLFVKDDLDAEYVHLDSPILRHFRITEQDAEVFFIITANEVEIRHWDAEKRDWTGDVKRLKVSIRGNTPICFIYHKILVIAESPSQILLINVNGECERIDSDSLNFPPDKYTAFVDYKNHNVFISLKAGTHILKLNLQS